MPVNKPRRASGLRLCHAGLIAFAFVIVGQASARAPAAAARPPVEAAVLKAEDQLFAADVHHDVAAIERGFADEAAFVHANGMTQTKAEYIAATRAAKFPITSIDTEGRVVRVFGRVAVVRGIKKLTVGDMHLKGSYLTVYVLRDGRWQMLDQQSAPEFKPSGGK